jgi:hypothetical protein
MERDITILEAGTGDSPNPRSDHDDDDEVPIIYGCLTRSPLASSISSTTLYDI